MHGLQGEILAAEVPPAAITEEDVVAAEAAVQQQADAVRALKEGGLTNTVRLPGCVAPAPLLYCWFMYALGWRLLQTAGGRAAGGGGGGSCARPASKCCLGHVCR